MDTFLNDLSWMSWNVALAFIPVWCVVFLQRRRKKWLRLVVELLWLAFLPNTIYLVTDWVHFASDIVVVSGAFKIGVVSGYLCLLLLGFLTYWWSMQLLDESGKQLPRGRSLSIVLLLNILISFGLVIGRFGRVNTWDLLLSPLFTLEKSLSIFLSPHLLSLFFLDIVLVNGAYFVYKVPWLHRRIPRI